MKNNVYKYRIKLKLTQAQLAAKCKTTRQTIHSIECAKSNPSGILMLLLAKYLKQPVDKLFEL